MNKVLLYLKNNQTKTYIWILRILVGSIFVLSGVTKFVDLWGFIYKIEQYLTIWGIPEPRSIVFMIALSISSFEFIMGALLLVGSLKRTSAWSLLALMVIMLPLSLYIAIVNPVDDCGCFGDFIKFSNNSTFIKNIVITIFLIYLSLNNHKIKGLYNKYIQWIQIFIYISYAIIISLIGYNTQPLIDFRGYKTGTNISSIKNNDTEISFVYERNGVREEFDINNLPDSTWSFIERIEASDNDFANRFTITDDFGDDITPDIISDYGEQLLLLIPEIDRADISYTYLINEINQIIVARGGNMIGLFSTNQHGVEYWKDISMSNYDIYTIEDTDVKEIARGNIALVYLIDGIIQWKRTLSSIDASLFMEEQEEDPFKTLYINNHTQFIIITGIHLIALIILFLIDYFRQIVKQFLFRKPRKRV